MASAAMGGSNFPSVVRPGRGLVVLEMKNVLLMKNNAVGEKYTPG